MIGKVIAGNGFKGAASYILDGNDSDHPGLRGQIISSSLSASDSRSIAREFRQVAQLRPDCAKPVLHISISLPPPEKLTDEKWAEVAGDFLREMGINDQHQFLVARHSDTEHDHVHLLVNRVGIDGSIWDRNNAVQRAHATCRTLELRHGLTVVSSQKRQVKVPTSGEINMAARTKKLPPRVELQRAIDAACADRPPLPVFVERLQAAGVAVRPNIAKTGTMNGFSFAFDGVAFKASDLGKSYTWRSMQERVGYEKNRHHEFLAQLSGQASPGSADLAPAGPAKHPANVPAPVDDSEPGAADRQQPTGALPAVATLDNPRPAGANRRAATRPAAEVSARLADLPTLPDQRQDLHSLPALAVSPPTNQKGTENAKRNHQPNPAGPGREAPPPTRGRLRTLSAVPVVHHQNPSEVLLPADVRGNLVDRGADSDHGVRREKGGGQRIAEALPEGFARVEDLPQARGWVDAASNYLSGRGLRHAHRKGFEHACYFSASRPVGSSPIAIERSDGALHVPAHEKCTDVELESIVALVAADSGGIQIEGTQEFCAKVEEVAQRLGLEVKHPYQVSPEERAAALAHLAEAERQQHEEDHNRHAPTPTPH